MAGKFMKFTSIIAALSVIFAAATVQNTFAFDLEENSRERERIANENSALLEGISENQKTIKEKQLYSKQLQKQIQELTQKIKESNERIKTLNEGIKEKQRLIDEKLQEIADRLDLLRTRLRAVYMAGDTSSLEIILGAKSFSDFIDKAQMIKSMSDYDANLISNLQKKMDAISLEQKQLRQDKDEVEKEKKSLEENKKEVNDLSIENQALIEELISMNRENRDAMRENELRQKVLEDALEQYNKEVAEKARQERIARMLEQQRLARENGIPPEILVRPVGDEYVWPCPGYTYLTALFDEERYYGIHGAIDIAGAGIYGASVVACADGYVFDTNISCPHDYGKEASCGCGGGFGNYIMIDHGNGKISVYAHLSGLIVSVGQKVQAGQVIGYVGTTGYSTGPHLHFETRYDGIRYDPLLEFE